MVEPPIKKSDRQQQPPTDSEPPSPSPSPNFERPIKASERELKPAGKDSDQDRNSDRDRSSGRDRNSDRDRNSGRGKKAAFSDESKGPVNMALARGPKPVKPQAKVELEPGDEADSEPTSEEPQN